MVYCPGFETAWRVLGEAGRDQYGARLYRAACPDCAKEYRRTKNALQRSPRCAACRGRSVTKAREARDAAEAAADTFRGWTVLGEAGRTQHGAPLYRVRCKGCSTEYLRTKTNLRRNACRPCASRKQAQTHGLTGSALYVVWNGMLQRCKNPKHPAYARYGGRGIGVDPAWESFSVFFADMHEGYSADVHLDRRDNDRGYCKENCRWVSPATNARNRSTARLITAFGRTANLVTWAEELGVNSSVISNRIANGWAPEDAVSTPSRKLTKRKAT